MKPDAETKEWPFLAAAECPGFFLLSMINNIQELTAFLGREGQSMDEQWRQEGRKSLTGVELFGRHPSCLSSTFSVLVKGETRLKLWGSHCKSLPPPVHISESSCWESPISLSPPASFLLLPHRSDYKSVFKHLHPGEARTKVFALGTLALQASSPVIDWGVIHLIEAILRRKRGEALDGRS